MPTACALRPALILRPPIHRPPIHRPPIPCVREVLRRSFSSTPIFDHVIIGAGVTGASVAYHLARTLRRHETITTTLHTNSSSRPRDSLAARPFDGPRAAPRRVLLLDRGSSVLGGCALGQTARSAGIVVVGGHKSAEKSRWAAQTRDDCEELERDGFLAPGAVNRCGSVTVREQDLVDVCAEDFSVEATGLASAYLRAAKAAFSAEAGTSFEIREETHVEAIETAPSGPCSQDEDLRGAVRLSTNAMSSRSRPDDILARRVYLATGIWSEQLLDVEPAWVPMRSHYWEFGLRDPSHCKLFGPEWRELECAQPSATPRDRPAPGPPILLTRGLYAKPSKCGRKVEVGLQEGRSFGLERCPGVDEVDGVLGAVKDEQADSSTSGDGCGPAGPIHLLFEAEAASGVVSRALGKDFLDHAEVLAYVAGFSSYTADGGPALFCRGSSSVLGYGGCCGYGVTWAGGLGKLLAETGTGGLGKLLAETGTVGTGGRGPDKQEAGGGRGSDKQEAGMTQANMMIFPDELALERFRGMTRTDILRQAQRVRATKLGTTSTELGEDAKLSRRV